MKKLFTVSLLLLGLSLSAQQKSPYIHKVYDFCPAPGQFANELPEYESGDNAREMALKAEESIEAQEKILVSLGGYGGYIIFGFDHEVINVPNEYDFKILGNAFYANANPNPDAPEKGGSSEPGIVMVSYDANGNGRPDDEWYELAGSEYYKPETIHNYKITYYKPDPDKPPTPDMSYPALNDTTYIRWVDNQGNQGYISRNVYHDQPYWHQWIEADTLVFEGTKLADNYIDESGVGSYYVQYAYGWGYVDNHPNSDQLSNFNIEWAVDKNGNKVNLSCIHFIKIYTAVNQYCGWLGETSTEIMGAKDLHPNAAASIQHSQQAKDITLLNNPIKEQLIIASAQRHKATVYNTSGTPMMSFSIEAGTNYIPCQQLPSGLYVIVTDNKTIKFIKI
ncbi:MAG: T9SS type A sorting domain-containing protein [Bacteroidales bacterium]|jgi:hypothetical protein|nr:T9SS type A sorting domain-containing protein [Bacteroidales bacterium]